MAGNTRGKLKEHFEGIHKNFAWCVTHCNKSLDLIHQSLSFTDDYIKIKDNPEAVQAFLLENPMYQGVTALAESIATLDEIAQGIYNTF